MSRKRSIEQAACDFGHLSDATRLRVLILLNAKSVCVTDLASIMDLQQPAVSHHLKLMLSSDLITSERCGKKRFYTLTEDGTNIIKLIYESGIVDQGDIKKLESLTKPYQSHKEAHEELVKQAAKSEENRKTKKTTKAPSPKKVVASKASPKKAK